MVHAGRNAEDDGWVMVVVWNGARCASDLVILRAGHLSEQGRPALPLALPMPAPAAGRRRA